jgi:hypothetical protein
MPSSSQRQHDLMNKWFGSIDICGPLDLLLSHGFIEKGGWITPPVPAHNVSEIESECLDFLFYEWDFCYGQSRPTTNA